MSGHFYPRLRSSRGDDEQLASCVERVVNQLEDTATASDSPGMLLGKIQSGKTRGFVGAIARAFDRGFDIALVLTKGTKTLSAQTVARLQYDFSEFLDEDELMVLDIMKMPGKLRRSELSRKIVVVAKKQAQNLDRLLDFLSTNEALHDRRVLLIDDEADLASVRFVRRTGQTVVEQGRIAEQMDDLRRIVDGIAFLQVTATPYSLYLQPEEYQSGSPGGNFVFKPKKPAFTELLPIHSGYVGGDDYFGGYDDNDPRHYLFVEVSSVEQDALRRADRRRISKNNVLDGQNSAGLRRSIMTFLLAVVVRRWQQDEAGEKKQKYAMVIHNDTLRTAHSWQDQVIDWIFEHLEEKANADADGLRLLFDPVYDDLAQSVAADKGRMPDRETAFGAFVDTLQSDDVVREKVNSDNEVMNLLDAKSELKLRTPFNIFVGGQILDRGITIPNLISFYYGRNPGTMQADTVLQHSRMYGNRSRRDLAVTRFYTSQVVYDRLYTINTFENALRRAFESGAHDQGVVFLQTDAQRRIRPCAPNKILLSNLIAVEPAGLLLPTGFETIGGPQMKALQRSLDDLIDPAWRDSGQSHIISRDLAFRLMDLVKKTFVFSGPKFEWNAMRGLVDYYAALRPNASGEMLLIAETGRRLNRRASGDKSGRSILGPVLRPRVVDVARDLPMLVMLQQEGSRERGWSGHKFWWPILAAPTDVEPCVFATKTID